MTKDKKNDNKEFLSFIQESGLIWGPSPEIYGGLAGFYTYGPLGKLLKNKVENSVRKVFNQHGLREIEGPTVVPDIVWKASGHLDTFKDRLVRCSKCNAVFRADNLIEEGRQGLDYFIHDFWNIFSNNVLPSINTDESFHKA